MSANADKAQENKSQSIANENSQMQSDGESAVQFVDNRPETIALRKRKEIANNSPQAKQLKAFQKIVGNSPRAKQIAQLRTITKNYSAQQHPIQKRENKTGLPDHLKSGLENLSNLSMDDVKVHYNSDKPAQLKAHAYAQSANIYLSPGQEKHLPHEAWHVVQQKLGRVQPSTQMKHNRRTIELNDDAGLEKEADVMGEKALQMKFSETGNKTNWTPLPAINHPYQFKPIDDPKHSGFKMDDNEPWLKLKTIKAYEDPVKVDFQIRNLLTPLYWKESEEDKYYTDSARESEYNLTEEKKTHEFGAWSETYKETLKEHARIDALTELNGITSETKEALDAEKERVKNGISMYLLQQFITNALFREEEIERMDYQATPFNFQENSQYLRSFATSYTNALEAKLPGKYRSEKLFLTRTSEMGEVLSQFFEVMKVNTDTDIDLDGIKAHLKKTVEKSAEYLFQNDKDLTEYWEGSGNTQAFVDVTTMIKDVANSGEQHAITEQLGSVVKSVFIKAVSEKLIDKEMETVHGGKGELDQIEIKAEIKKGIDNFIHDKEIDDSKDEIASGKKNEMTQKYKDKIPGFVAWLKLKDEQERSTNAKRLVRDFDAQKVTDVEKHFSNLVQNDEFKNYLDSTKKSVTDPATFTKDGAEGSYDKLKTKVQRAFDTANMAVTTGGVITIEGKDNQFDQPAILVDDHTMGMAVKTAINKSGNVPNPTDSTRKLMKTHPLKDIALEIIKRQKSKGSDSGRGKLKKLEAMIRGFKPEEYTSLAQVDDQLTKTQTALEQLKLGFAEDTTNLKIEVDAAVKLLEGTGALSDDTPLPKFVLKQLEMHLQDALLSKGKVEDLVRNLQGIHEAVILKLELEKSPVDNYDYHAPQKIEETEDEDKFFQGAHLADYGLKAFSQAYNAVVDQATEDGTDSLNIQAFYNIYFELNDKLNATRNTSKGSKVTLESPSSVDNYLLSENYTGLSAKTTDVNVIMVDIHPNDATKENIAANNVSKLIDDVFTKLILRDDYDAYKLTVMVDITLNHTSEEEINEIRTKAHDYIASGNLNLVFVQSLTKFTQLGMDKQSGGLVFAYNKGEAWEKFNDSMKVARESDPVDPTIQKYFQALFKHTNKEQVDYIKAVRSNTKKMHEMLKDAFEKLDISADAITVTDNTDDGTCYVSIRYDDFIAKIYPIESAHGYEEMHQFNVDVLEKGINTILRQTGLAVAMRFSFGFPVSNLGETGKEVRFTIGLEGEDELQKYVDILAYINGSLGQKFDDLDKELVKDFTPLSDGEKRTQFLQEITTGINDMITLRNKLADLVKDEG